MDHAAARVVHGQGPVRRALHKGYGLICFNRPPRTKFPIIPPRVRQSGLGLAQHGCISKRRRSHARAMLVEAAWAAAKAPGRLRAFFLRTRARRGHQITAVAIARKLAVLCWHMLTKNADYQWARRIPPVWTALPGRAGMTGAAMFA